MSFLLSLVPLLSHLGVPNSLVALLFDFLSLLIPFAILVILALLAHPTFHALRILLTFLAPHSFFALLAEILHHSSA